MNMTHTITTGQFVQNFRAEHSLSQVELAELCGFGQNVVSGFERGKKPWSRNFKALAEGTGVSLELIKSLPIGPARAKQRVYRKAAVKAPKQTAGKDEKVLRIINELVEACTPKERKQVLNYILGM